jgi:hypothetical protein
MVAGRNVAFTFIDVNNEPVELGILKFGVKVDN